MDSKKPLIELAAQIVAAYVGHNTVPQSDLPKLIADVHRALGQIGGDGQKDDGPDMKPAVNVKKSITPDYLICLEDERSSSR